MSPQLGNLRLWMFKDLPEATDFRGGLLSPKMKAQVAKPQNALSLKGKKLDFYGRGDTYVRLNDTIPELSRFTVCIDLISRMDNSSEWIAFSYMTNNTLLGREDIDLGLAGDHQQIILYNLGKIFSIHYHLTPFQWHTVCLIWDGVKGMLELFLNKERLLVMMDQPQNLTANGTLVLGHLPANRNGHATSVAPSFTGSLCYFQLWDHILENEDLMKCLDGNVVSWKEDAWLVNNMIPTVDKTLRCFVSDNITTPGTSTTLSQQIHFTTPSQITGLNLGKPSDSSTVISKSNPVFETSCTTVSYSNRTYPPLETTTASKNFPSTAATSALAAGILSTPAAVTSPTKSTSKITTKNSMKTSKFLSPERTMTTKTAESLTSETFHPMTATDFLYTSGFPQNSLVSKTSSARSQTAFLKTTSLFSSIESTSVPTTSTAIGTRPFSTTDQAFLPSSAAGTVPWSTVEQALTTTAHTGAASVFPPEIALNFTAAPVESVLTRNQTASTVYPVTLSTRSIETKTAPRTTVMDSASINFQTGSSSNMEDAISASVTKEASSIALSFRTSSSLTGAQSVQTVPDAETAMTVLLPGITLAPMVTETIALPTVTGLVYTQNVTTAGESTLPLNSTRSASTAKALELGPTTLTDETTHALFTNETTWTSGPDQHLVTSINTSTIFTFMPNENFTSSFRGSTSNAENSFTTVHITIPPDTFTESEATTATDAVIAATARYTTVLSKLTSPWFANLSTISGAMSVPKSSESKATTLQLKPTPMFTVATNELLSTPRETVPPEDMKSTLAVIESYFSTENPSETTQTEAKSAIPSEETTGFISTSVTAQLLNATLTRQETTSSDLRDKSATAVTPEVSPFPTKLEATHGSAQKVTAAITMSPVPNSDTITTPVDNKTATAAVRESWLSTKSMKSTSPSLSPYTGTTEIFHSTHTSTACWMSETPPEGNSAPSPTSEHSQTFPDLLDVSTPRTLGNIVATAADSTPMVSWSAGTLPPSPPSPATPGPPTHMVSVSVNDSTVTSLMVSDETKVTMTESPTLARTFSTSALSDPLTLPSAAVTTASVTIWGQSPSTANNAMPSHTDSVLTTSEVTVTSLTEAPVPSPSPPTLMTTHVGITLPSISSDTVTPSTHPLTHSASLPDNIPVMSSTRVFATTTTPATTLPTSEAAEATLSGGTDVPSLVTGTTETSVVDETMPSHTSTSKLTTSVDSHNSQFSTHLVDTPVPTLLMKDTSIVSSDKEQMITSLGNTPKTMEAIETSPSKMPFTSYSHGTSSLEMPETETITISSIQAHSPSEIPLGTLPEGSSALYPTSGSTLNAPPLTSTNTVDAHFSEMSTSAGETTLRSQAQTVPTLSSSQKGNMSTLTVHTPRSVEMTASVTSVTHPVSFQQDTSFVETSSYRATRLSTSMSIGTTTSQLPSLRTQPVITSVFAPLYKSTQTSSGSLSLSTTGLSNANFTVISTNDKNTTVLSVPSVPTLGKTSTATPVPTSQMASLPITVTAFTSRSVSDTPTMPVTKPSKTTYAGCLRSPSVVTLGPISEISSLPVNDSTSSPAVPFSDTSTIESFSTLLSPPAPRTTTTTEISTVDVIAVTYTWPTAKDTMVSSALTTSEMTKTSSGITPTSFSSRKTSTFPSVKTTPTTTDFSLLSSENNEAISSSPMATLPPILSTTQELSKEVETTTLNLLPGMTDISRSTVSSGRVTGFTDIYSSTIVPENMPSSFPSHNIHTSRSKPASSSLTDFHSTPGPTRSAKVPTSTFSETGKITSLSENISLTDELTKSATSVNTSTSHPLLTPSLATPFSFTPFLNLPHSTDAYFTTTTTSPVPTSQVVEFPVQGTVVTSSTSQSLLKTPWNAPTATDIQWSTSITVPTPTSNRIETETPPRLPVSWPMFTASQTGLVSEGATSESSIRTSGIPPTLGFSENPLLASSPSAAPPPLQTFEMTTTPALAPGITLPVPSSGVLAEATLSKAAASLIQTWVPFSLPSSSPLTTLSQTPQAMTSSTLEKSQSTLLASDMTPTPSFTALTTFPFAIEGPVLTRTTFIPTMAHITTGFPTSLQMSREATEDNGDISTRPGGSPRTTVMANSRTVSQLPSFSMISMSPLITNQNSAIGSVPLSSPTIASSWGSAPAGPTSPTSVLSKPTLDSLPNIVTIASTATEASFPLKSTGITHPSIATVSSLISSSYETTWLHSTPSFLSRGTMTSTLAAESTVSFYNIVMNFSVTDGEPRILITSVINKFAEYWLNSIFQDSEFVLANLATQIKNRDTLEEEMTMDRTIWEQREGQGMDSISRVPYSCVCQVIIKANSSLASNELIHKIRSKIHGNITHGNFTQDQLTLLVKSEDVAVKKLEPGKCRADETVSKFKGTYKWLLTNPTEVAQARCIKNEDGSATRICSISISTGKSQWEKPKFKQCKLLQGLPDKIVDLANITINDENADDVAVHILNLINESPPLDEEEIKIIVSKVADISQCNEISMNLTQIILQIISAVLGKHTDSTSDLHEVSNEILRIIDRAGHKMEFWGRTANLTVARLALAVLQVDHTFEGMTFSIRSYEEGANPEIYLGEVPLGKTLASIYLPKSLRERIPLHSLQTILFNFFGQTSLFKTKSFTTALRTYVVSASISDNMSIQNLADPVVITLQHIEGNRHGQVHCAFWDFGKNNGLGGWNSSGCKVNETNVNYTICQCDHLTHFGVLMDLSRSTVDEVNERILVLITYAGCGISSIFLGIAVVTYVVFHKLRKDHPSKILVNLCIALLMLNMVFLVNSWSASFQNAGLCITAAVALHYFLLASLTWMGLEAVHMYFALVKVFNIYIPNYILKFCLIGWGIPAITVAIILSVKKDFYGTLSPATQFCWIKDDFIFYISVVAYFCLIFIMNLSMFCTVLIQLNSMKVQSQKTRRKMILHDLKGTTSLTFLLGLTWGFAFFAWGPVRILFLYLFAIANTLQGFLIFVFHCAMKETVREQWLIHLCCRWFQMDNSSDVSSRYGLKVVYKQERLKKNFEHRLLTPSLKSTTTNCTLKFGGSTQGTPSDISFPSDGFDEDPYCFSPLGCEAVPNCVRRIWPMEIKVNPIHKQRFLQ
ncbi:adhesion G-protein coupled receptor G4 [Tenrec ecaudatus]|uniref:adhesion G-protein coupled receptor G4 n=1 Tax=Tenrec ecaudatus TaxID=94439 RepID=UPI003F59D263